MDPFIEALKVKIIETLALEDVTPEDIDPEAQLVGGDLGIDSIHVLELVMLVEKEYGAANPTAKNWGRRSSPGWGPLGPISKKCKKKGGAVG